VTDVNSRVKSETLRHSSRLMTERHRGVMRVDTSVVLGLGNRRFS